MFVVFDQNKDAYACETHAENNGDNDHYDEDPVTKTL